MKDEVVKKLHDEDTNVRRWALENDESPHSVQAALKGRLKGPAGARILRKLREQGYLD